MKLKEIKELYQSELKDLYPLAEITTFFNWLCESYLQLKPYQIQQEYATVVSGESVSSFKAALVDLKAEKPIQYILGNAHFYGLEFAVNKHTLIPRPETEELVSWVLENVKTNKEINILDIGTGSGCIPIAIAKNVSKANVYAVDISKEALEVAKLNAVNNNVNVSFSEVDILKASNLADIFPKVDKYDVIISNPPYVRNLEKVEIKNNVLQYEPETALFVADDNALIFYNKIAALASDSLVENGELYFEINQYLGEEMLQLMGKHNFRDNELRKDLFGNYRMLKGLK